MANLKCLIGYILVYLAFSAWGHEPDISTIHPPQGHLKIALDIGLARTQKLPGATQDLKPHQRNTLLSTHIVLPRPVSELFNDAQLWKIARDAYAEVKPEMEQYGFIVNKDSRPLAMSILAWGNEIILASSQKGQSYIYESQVETEVLKDLQLCQAVDNSDKRHKSSASCGEEMTAHLYNIFHPEGPKLRTLNPQAVMATWVAKRKTPLIENPDKMDPCADSPHGFGCNRFTGNGPGGQNFRVLNADMSIPLQDYTLPPGTIINQYQICGSIREHD